MPDIVANQPPEHTTTDVEPWGLEDLGALLFLAALALALRLHGLEDLTLIDDELSHIFFVKNTNLFIWDATFISALMPVWFFMYKAWVQAGDMDVVRAVIRDFDIPLFDYVRAVEGGYDAAFHGIFEIAGVMKRHRRPPYHSLTEGQMTDLRAFLRDGGWL